MASTSYRKQELIVHDSAMATLIFEPDGDGPFPAVVVAQHLPVAHAGLETDPFTIDVGERLAVAGYVAVIPFLFHWWPADQDMMEKARAWRDDWNVADLDAAFAATAALSNVDADRIAIIGHCWGGRVAWLGACTNSDYAAAAMFYGGRIKMGLGPDAPPAIDLADQIACPLFGVFGNNDQNPSPDDVSDISSALDDVGVAHEFHHYDDAGHGFQDFTNGDRYRPEQSRDAWTKLFEFLARSLATEA